MTIHLPEDLESPLRAAVCSGHFASVDEAVAEAVRSFLRQRPQPGDAASEPASGEGSAPARKPIWEVAAEIREGAPEEEWARLPADGAEQHDHYIYGTPNRPRS